ncbi:hypothetical protein BATDEDRAFT_36121 [Batrachochytrium dendrobatidis JAM81]|uniref:Vesicle tethering protein Uso1/P115-like head domain-containing protein n=1 Tax=Batrachochytrium dendrobatidis (strain JAM81 / FGSC 10211) TaxID=684364 RepID=F4PCC2_BATDJ|nr:uncharacterized protein BATDEDRAFT_36121 [Batrachochytrium dendrobatidis JAM81]EGF77134.1 hypothetical protein BATDEDRAFT_36121 [Batrachochytrium dendrobatidis JAM81]KAK5665552.1 Vesicle-mediated ER to Golgi transport protein [Batrachochytrium dendrobatidis]|eukprot:XP_006682236.1 hypothetical protein BATDEDRAFT_36121 [Batrachochytrium dendrobatidis JAM81]
MDFLMSGYSALKGQKGQPQSPQETIDKLCDRVMNSTLLEDRRAAVQVLRGLARDWQLDVGTKAMSALINVLKSDRMDVEIIKSTLETLNILCAQEATTPKTTDPANNDGHDVGTMFTEIYTKDAANVTLLLDILAELDFYVRLDTVQFLTTLLHNAGPHLQDCVLTSPMGISRLIDLLDDRREIIRNEGLLLLISLTQSNADIQKIIAFENAFERLLSIILDEGATDGGIIVQDCLQLMQNLLRHNVSNQNLFRETSCIKQLGKLLVSKVLSHDHNNATDLPLTHERTEWTDQKMANVNSVLELVCILVAEKNPNTSMNQTALGHANVIVPLFQLGMALHVPTRVRAQALFTVADAIRGNLVNQETFGKSVITVVTRPEHVGVSNQKQSPGAPRPSIISIILVAMGRDHISIRAAATYIFQAYVYKNPDSQLALVSTFVPPPADNPNSNALDLPVSPGSLLISSILDLDESRKDSFISWFATSIFQHLIRDNRQSKQTAALIKFEEGEEHISLLHKCMYTLLCASRNGVHLRVQIGLWTLLAQWLYDCPRAVKEFLTEGSNMQFLVEQVNQSSGVNAVVQGLAAFIIGLCYEFNDDSEPVFSRANIQGLVMSRIGSDVFQSRLERLRESKQFNSSFLHILKKNEIVDPKNGPEIYFDHSFVEFFKSHYDLMIRSVTTVLPKDAPPGHRHGVDESSTHTNHLRDNSTSPMHNGFNEAAANEIAQHKAALEALEKTVASQQEHIKKLESTLAQFNQPESNNSTQVNQLTTTITELQLSLDQERAKRLEIEQEQEDLLVCFAEQDMENSELKNRLKTYGEVFEENDE